MHARPNRGLGVKRLEFLLRVNQPPAQVFAYNVARLKLFILAPVEPEISLYSLSIVFGSWPCSTSSASGVRASSDSRMATYSPVTASSPWFIEAP